MIKDQRLLGHANYTFPNMFGKEHGVYRLEYTINLSQSFLNIYFGDSAKVLFIEDKENKGGIKISNSDLAKNRFEKMDSDYRKSLIRLVDPNGEKLLLKGIAKCLGV